MKTWDAVSDPVSLRHGYTTADLEVLTRRAASSSRWRFLPYDERADIARFAIVEHIMAAAYPPDFWPMVTIGEKAIGRHVLAEQHWRGYYLTGDPKYVGTPMGRFYRYWHGSTRLHGSSPEDRLVDHLALHQIWPKLTEMQQDALLALAHYGDYEKAAAELGISRSVLDWRLHKARNVFLRWWHQHENASRLWAHNRRPGPSAKGHGGYRGATGIIRIHKRYRIGEAAGHDARCARPAASS